MTRRWIRATARWTIFLYLFQIVSATLALAGSPIGSLGYEELEPQTQSTFNLQSDTLGVPGPVSFGIEYDTLEKTIFNAQYVHEFNENFALGLLGEYGINQFRVNATAGFGLYSQGDIKFTAEYLSQVFPFKFDSGDSEHRVYQNAYGARFQHNMNQSVLQNINAGAYWAKAPNKELSTRAFIGSDGREYQNQRNLAGATSQGLDLGTTLKVSDLTSFDGAVYYDDVHYNTELTEHSDQDASEFGGALKVNQLIGQRMKLSAEASLRAIYDTYDLELAYSPLFARDFGMEVIASAQRLISSNDTPNSNTYGLNFSFLGGKTTAVPPYTLAGVADQTRLADWVKTPAVYMDRVLIIGEEITTLAPIVKHLRLNYGPESGGNTVTLLGNNFSPGTQVIFDENPSVELSYVSAQELQVIVPPAQEPGIVNVRLINPNGKSLVLEQAYTYLSERDSSWNLTTPTIASISPVIGPLQGGTTVVITGSGFSTVAGAPGVQFNDSNATSYTVNSDTQITAVTPAGTAGVADVTVQNSLGSATLDSAYTYQPAPTLTSLSPNLGPPGGGQTITLTGTNFISPATVTIGGVSATSVTVVNATTITALTPAGSGNNLTVSISTAGGSASLASGYSYNAPPVISSISPAAGPDSGGTTITILGSSFTGTTSGSVGGNALTSLTVNSDTVITAITPAGTAGAATITLTNAWGTGSLSGGFTYETTPTVTSVSPNAGPTGGGNSVVITGTGFLTASGVKFANKSASSYTINSDTQITAVPPSANAGAVDVLVTNTVGTGTGTAAYTYLVSPTVSSISPNAGSPSGGQTITITGANFVAPATVVIGSTSATSVSVVNSSTITAVTPAGSGTNLAVSVSTPGGTAMLSNGYTYNAAPTVTSVSPSAGPIIGGTSITITGTSFTGATAVTIGGTAATSYTVNSSSSITAVVPAHAAGAANVSVTTAFGTGTLTGGFTYVTTPTITSVTPNAGPTSGGNSVIITGTGFSTVSGNTAVKFGNKNASGYVVNSDTQITVPAPSSNAGTVNVIVKNSEGTTTATGAYTYENAPSVTSISPNAGTQSGGQSVTITGTNFVSPATVTIGSNNATSVVVVNATTITAVIPAGPGGLATVSVTTPGGTGSLTNGYNYYTAPTITSVSPLAGPVSGGTSVTLTGTSFTGATAVTIGGTAVTSFTVNSDTTISAVTPAGTAGAKTVAVTTAYGTGSLSGGFTYETTPTITSVSPNMGDPAGGNTVIITGTGFLTVSGNSAVKFGNKNASYTVLSDTQISAVTPSASIGSVDVIVSNAVGTATATNAFTYQVAPTVTAISPSTGPQAGGQTVTITGTNLLAPLSVTIGGAAATNVTIVDSTSVTAVTPPGLQGTATVVVNAAGGSASLANAYTYVPVPVATGLSPTAGPLTGGQTITITGKNFIAPVAVTVGGVAASSVTLVDSNTITAVTPVHTKGTVNVVVTALGGTANLMNIYQYLGVPTTTAVSPLAGPIAGGQAFTLTGTNFTLSSNVTVGGNNATNVVVVSDTQITGTTPAGTAGPANISVTSPGGTGTFTNGYVYDGVPTITSVSPNAGPTSGSNSVVITGTGLLSVTGAAGVQFGSNNATSYTPDSDIQITAVVPAGTAGSVNLQVTNSTSSVTSTNAYTYVPAPTLTSVSPNAGPIAGGQTITLTGTNFISPVTVTVGGVAATSVTIVNSTTVTAVTPANSVGAVNVVLSTQGGTATLTNGYTYDPVPTLTAISPISGPLTGNQTITLTGTGFAAPATVTVGGNAATSVNVVNATTITAVTPAGTAGTVSVVLTTPGGSATLSNSYTYQTTPTVTNVNPNSGLPSGGNSVVITGTNFIGTMGVSFGANFSPSVTVNSATQITAVAPAGTAGTYNVRVTTPSGTSTIVPAAQYTYQTVPTVTAIAPNAGVPAGGTSVIITGTNFTAATAVKFGATDATSFTVNNSTQITAVSPAGTGTVDITVTTPVGTSATSSADQFTFEDPPTITNLSSGVGVPGGGTSVVITGTNFINTTSVKFGSTNATSFTVNSATQITAVTPAGTGTVNVTVTTPVGTNINSSANQFVYQTAPTVTSLSPTAGLPAGGTTVTINGTNFTGATSVQFGSTNAASFTVVSATQITAVSPAGTQGQSVHVTVTTPIGTSATSSSDQFLYQSAPTITTISPNAGLPAGGTTVVITGTNFTQTLGVSFGSNFSPSFTVDSATQITAVAPAGSAGTINVRVTTPVGTSTIVPAAQYTYEGTPTVTQVFPNAGLPAGGTSVQIAGTNFINASAVYFGATPAASFTVNSSTLITAVSPVGTQGSIVDITVVTPVGTSPITSVDEYAYEDYPAISGLSPNVGVPSGGTTVVITGTNFTNDLTVTFGTNLAPSFTVDSPTQITAISPAGSAGPTSVRVTTPVGTSPAVPAGTYTYQTVPTVTGISPAVGLPTGGTSVVITGTNFVGTTAVNFGSTAATSFTVNSGTQITATAPAGTGTVDITVTTPIGTSSTSSADQFSYQNLPNITGVSPNAGLPEGGTSVVITGQNFTEASAVSFGGNAATAFNVDSATQITATSPAGTGTVDIRVTTPIGISAITSADHFTYEGTPTVTALSPATGPLAGGSSVVITGTNFTGATAVSFGGTAATSFTVDSGTQITAVSPAGTGAVDVIVTTPVGTSGTSSADQFIYQGAPSVTSIAPAAGVPAGGTTVLINGTNLIGATTVQFGSTAAASFTVLSATQIRAISPAGTDGTTVDITVTTPSGTSNTSSADQYTYEGLPTITNLSPNAGDLSGGTTVVITGTNFIATMGVSFGPNFSPSVTVDSPTQITAIAPAGTEGTFNVRVTTPVGTSTIVPEAQYTYEGPPTVTQVFPNAGLPAGGTSVQIAGTNFTAATAVYFGATAAPSFTVNSSTLITAISPAGTQGSIVDITVVTPVGTSPVTSVDQYAYEGYPMITGLSPKVGLPSGGTTVVITGINFTNDLMVTFGTNLAPTFTVDSPTQITTVSPAGSAGPTNVRVTTPVGTSPVVPAGLYTYQTAPTVTGVSPTAGLPTGGATVVISGTNFVGASAVNFGSTPATSFTINNGTQITATAPAGTGTVDITVTTPIGTSATSSADEFVYEDEPSVTNVNPAAGLPAGGTTVVITGTNFIDATAVNFDGTPAASFTVDSATKITAVTPAGSGTVNVTVVTPVGTSSATSLDQFTFQDAPTVTQIFPNAGLPAGGTMVQIAGTNLTAATAVYFGATASPSFTVNSATSMSAVSPVGVQGSIVDLRVETPVGISPITSADEYAYEGYPSISSISPRAGTVNGGTTVVITGINFTDDLQVTFGTSLAPSFTVDSPTQITAISPPRTAGPINVRVTTPVGTSPLQPAGLYTYDNVPTISSITPNAGGISGGTSVNVTGTGFLSVTSVKFGTLDASAYTINSDTSLTAVTPAHSAGPVDLVITNTTGSVTRTNGYTYNNQPTLASINPTIGNTAGGTEVTFTGTGLLSTTAVKFGSLNASSFTIIDDTTLTAVSPAQVTGPVNVSVTNSVGTVSLTNAFTYESTPNITLITPQAGPVAGGTSVVITGTSFNTATGVDFGSTPATSYTINSDTQITAIAPAQIAGAVNLKITNPAGYSTFTNGYTYDDTPVINGFNPSTGPIQGGTPVTITGTGFLTTTAVRFGTTAASSYSINSDTEITAMTPPHSYGPVSIGVTNSTGSATSSGAFTYEQVPEITAVAPSAGPVAGGTTVIITGSSFLTASSVTFGGHEANSYTIDSDTQITAVTPEDSAGEVSVSVINSLGLATLIHAYTYDDVPTVSAVNPIAGPVAGGINVTLIGTGFLTATAVNFGGVAATSFTINDDFSITAVVPAHAGGVVDVSVTNSTGTGSLINGFIYDDVPSLSAVSPLAGSIGGLTTVVITGSGFLTATGVKFGGVNAGSFTINSDTQITATTPAHAVGAVNVDVINSTGTGTLINGYTYDGTPSVTSVSPTAGPVSGGNSVVITGTGFLAQTAVYFGSTAVTATAVTDTQITLGSVPAGTGTVNVTVVNPDGTSLTTLNSQYTYGGPTILSLSPNAGSVNGGQTVTVSGSGFTQDSSVTINGNVPTNIKIQSTNTIIFTTPAGSAGVATVQVTTPRGTTSSNNYIYEGAPTLSSISPFAGPTAGNTSVTLTGTGFMSVTGASGVKFGTTNASSYTVVSDTQIIAIAPSHSARTVDMYVTNSAGTVVLPYAYTYDGPPKIASVSPTSGATIGGDTVTIIGSGYYTVSGASGVQFGGVNALSYSIVDDSTITAVTPVHGAGKVAVSITNTTNSTSAPNAYTYDALPTITNLSPKAGTTRGGTSVTLTGSGFSSATAVHFGVVPATSFVIHNDTHMSVVTPMQGPGTVNVTVTNAAGTAARVEGLTVMTGETYTYTGVPVISSISPASGSHVGGTLVLIEGQGFSSVTNASDVQFGTTNAASYTVTSDTSLTAITPAGVDGPVDLVITNATGTTSETNGFTYNSSPTITSLTPTSAPATGGGSLTIAGTGFITGSQVYLGNQLITPDSISDTQIVINTLPAGTGAIYVTVVNGNGATPVNNAAKFSYVPVLSAISPSQGSVIGGTSVTITGVGLNRALAVNFGSNNPGTITANTDTSLTVTSPAGTGAGIVDMTVKTSGGTSPVVTEDQFTYLAQDLPTVTALSPPAASISGGASVVITGTNFLTATAVNFGATPATAFTINSDTQITATAPASTSLLMRSSTVVSVTVTNDSGTSSPSSASDFTYTDVPTISTISPTSGSIGGMTSVTITGTGYSTVSGSSGVQFDSIDAQSYIVNSDTEIVALTPAHASGAVAVTVTNTSGTATYNSYTYDDTPAVLSLSSVSGPQAGGSQITIMGTGFISGSTVYFGATQASVNSITGTTEILVTVPAGTGTVDVTVVNANGTSALTSADQYTYYALPIVSGLSVNSGPPSGGTSVTVTGQYFTGATNVTFGGISADSFNFINDTTISAVSPAGTGSVDIQVITPGGTSATSSADVFTYDTPAPTVSAITPNNGSISGGTTVTLTGTNFTPGSTVTIGGLSATVTNVSGDGTTITATTPAHAAGQVSVVVTTASGSAHLVSSTVPSCTKSRRGAALLHPGA